MVSNKLIDLYHVFYVATYIVHKVLD